MRVYITKYALTKGIIVRRCAPDIDGNITIWPPMSRAESNTVTINKCNWYTCVEDAIKKANMMRLKEIDRLNNRVTALALLTFDPPYYS